MQRNDTVIMRQKFRICLYLRNIHHCNSPCIFITLYVLAIQFQVLHGSNMHACLQLCALPALLAIYLTLQSENEIIHTI